MALEKSDNCLLEDLFISVLKYTQIIVLLNLK